ncbi:MAG: hypothetical protein GY805_13980 [Chloroflexi bacterium]|nr:hypothetical protein [Chloroflexota bacterium]
MEVRNEFGIEVMICHWASKWNPIEHRLFYD